MNMFKVFAGRRLIRGGAGAAFLVAAASATSSTVVASAEPEARKVKIAGSETWNRPLDAKSWTGGCGLQSSRYACLAAPRASAHQ